MLGEYDEADPYKYFQLGDEKARDVILLAKDG